MKGEKNQRIISTDTEKVFGKIQYLFKIKIADKLGIEGVQAYFVLLFSLYCTLKTVHFSPHWRSVNTVASKSISATLQQHLLPTSHCPILVILQLFQTFSSLLHSLWWSVISVLRYYNCSCLGCHEPCPHEDSTLHPQMCMSWLLHHLPVSLPVHETSYLPETQYCWNQAK